MRPLLPVREEGSPFWVICGLGVEVQLERMDPWIAAIVAGFFAVASLGIAVISVFSTRSALAKATAITLANRTALENAVQTAHAARQEAQVAITRLAAVEKRLYDSDIQLKTALQRGTHLERRLAEAETNLNDGMGLLPPPPIPSGRSVARLESLRATLRAQATDEEEETTP